MLVSIHLSLACTYQVPVHIYLLRTHDKMCLRKYDVLEGVPVDLDIIILGPTKRKDGRHSADHVVKGGSIYSTLGNCHEFRKEFIRPKDWSNLDAIDSRYKWKIRMVCAVLHNFREIKSIEH